jgi:HK97 family phage major capsid protein
MNIKQLKQDKADLAAKLAALKAEGWKLGAVAAKDRTPEQIAALAKIDTDISAVNDEIAANATELARAQRYVADNTPAPSRIEPGQNRAELEPWAPYVVATDAPTHIKAEARHAALGLFGRAVQAACSGGQVDPRLYAAATGAGTQVDSQLGFAVPMEIAPGIERTMYENGKILSRVDVRSISGNSITYNVFDETSRADGSRQGGILGYWVDEGTAPTASMFKLARMEMKLRKVGTLGVMTDELIADAMGLGGELEQSFERELIFQVENKIYRGLGAGSPLGILNAPCLISITKETNQTAATIVTANLSKMWERLPEASEATAVWLVNKQTRTQLDNLFTPTGATAVAPRFVNYGPKNVLSMYGAEVVTVEYPAALGTVGDIALVDLRQYRLIRKGGVEQASSMHLYFSAGETAFRAFYRVDGQMVPRAAITQFQGTGTQSPAIVLATRA